MMLVLSSCILIMRRHRKTLSFAKLSDKRRGKGGMLTPLLHFLLDLPELEYAQNG